MFQKPAYYVALIFFIYCLINLSILIKSVINYGWAIEIDVRFNSWEYPFSYLKTYCFFLPCFPTAAPEYPLVGTCCCGLLRFGLIKVSSLGFSRELERTGEVWAWSCPGFFGFWAGVLALGGTGSTGSTIGALFLLVRAACFSFSSSSWIDVAFESSSWEFG